ncbi:MAG TPA: pilus assembly protein TadG-related protein [Methylotenera sp.]|nr:pilus assembly protein TadG-related protein [Methylotenera sp.]
MKHCTPFGGYKAMLAPKRQRGQALVFITVTSVVVLIALLATYNVGQLSYHRIKLQNTADAAAYSAAVVQARDLNFSAYMNRGVIANQVAVAQIVSLTGWARNFNDTYNGDFATISQTLAGLSSLGALWTTPFNALKTVSSGIKSVLDPVAGPAVKVMDVLIDALTTASKAYHFAMVVSIPAEVVPDVIKANEPQASVSNLGIAALTASAAQHLTFAKTFSPSQQKDGEDRMAKVTQASTDVFYKDRSLPPVWPIPILIDPTRLVTYGVGPLLMMQFHSGGSTLKSSAGNSTDHLKGYSSLDATGLFVIMCVTIPVFGIPVPIPFPLPPLPAGRGAAVAGTSNWASSTGLQPTNNFGHRNELNTGTDPLALVQYGAAHYNPMTAIPAWIKVGEGPGTNLDSRAGLRDYMDLSKNASNNVSKQANTGTNTATNNQNLRAPAWVLEIERSTSSLKTSNTGGTYQIGGGTDGKLSLPAKMNGGKMRALSKAEAYFSRPKALFPRYDSKTEWASLYSPYWQARLLPNSLTEQTASILATALF